MIKNQNQLGGICMILSVLFFSFMDCLIKLTAADFAVGQVMFSRALFGLIPIFFLIPKNGNWSYLLLALLGNFGILCFQGPP